MSERTPLIFFDNRVLDLITKYTQAYNNFYKSLNINIPYLNEFRIIFDIPSLLEKSGLSKIYKFQLKPEEPFHPNLKDKKIEQIINKLFLKARKHFLKHPKLKRKKLQNLIKKTLKCSNNPDTQNIINDTIIRYNQIISNRKKYKKFVKKCAHYLAWEKICEISFIYLDQISHKDLKIYKKFTNKIEDNLINIFYSAYKKGIHLNLYRLTDTMNKNENYFSIKLENNYSTKNNYYFDFFLVKNKDLCDSYYINLATLGYKEKPCIVFTTDKKIVIEDRLKYQQIILKQICAQKNLIKETPGIIFIVNETTGIIEDKIDVNLIPKNAMVHVRIKKNNQNKNNVIFKKT